jgi:hypothetical protein
LQCSDIVALPLLNIPQAHGRLELHWTVKHSKS